MLRRLQLGTGYWTRYRNPALNKSFKIQISGPVPDSGISRIVRETLSDFVVGLHLKHPVVHKSFGIANSHAKQRLSILHIFRQLYRRFS